MPTIIKTGISQAYWYSFDSKSENRFQPATIANLHTYDDKPEKISWFDKLLEGGIFLPKDPEDDKDRALSILITGPPGSGKSTLAMELCYRLTEPNKIKGKGINSLYITSESDRDWLIQKAKSFGWSDEKFKPMDKGKPRVPLVTVWQTKNFKQYLQIQTDNEISLFKLLIRNISKKNKITENIPDKLWHEIDDLMLKTKILDKGPELLVVDSLNTVQSYLRSDLFDRFMEFATCGPKIIVLIIDTGDVDDSCKYWEFLSDNVIRLDRVYKSGYMIRTIEVVKARYQPHIWGPHQLKIYSRFNTENLSDSEKRRAHPYREEGGIFIFPSIHYYLSSYKRKSPEKVPNLERTHLPCLNEILHGGRYAINKYSYFELKRRINNKKVLKKIKSITDIGEYDKFEFINNVNKDIGKLYSDMYEPTLLKVCSTGGFPSGRCTGFIGCRGGHKSHLGYSHLLYRILSYENEKGLIISLRDDEGMARKTMSRILKQEFSYINKTLSDLENDGKLEIIHYPPGYITPEEFYHRMYLSIHSMKKSNDSENNNTKITLLFNSLDQLSSRFPLCAKEEIFVPGIIETLSAEKITSFFIAVEEPGQPEEQYGLLSMADVIIRFSQKLFDRNHYCGHLNENIPKKDRFDEESIEKIKIGLGKYHPAVVMRVIRFAGGQAAGDGGILDLIDKRSPVYNIYKMHDSVKDEGLYFTPFSPKHHQGNELRD